MVGVNFSFLLRIVARRGFGEARFERVDFFLQRFQLFKRVRQLRERDLLAHLLFFGRRRNSDDARSGGNVAHDAGHRAERRAVADADMIAKTDAAGHDDVIAGRNASGDSNARANHVAFADFAVVRDHDVIVDFGAFADNRRVVSAAVDRRAGADFDVILDDDVSKLRRQDVNAGRRIVPETVRSDDAVGVKEAVFADYAVFVNDDVREKFGIFADFNARLQDDAGVNRRVVADFNVVADNGAGTDCDVFADFSGRSDEGAFRNALKPTGARRTEEGDDLFERFLDVGDLKRRDVGRRAFGAERNDGGARLGRGVPIEPFRTFGEGDCRRVGGMQGRGFIDQKIGIAG